MDHIFITNFKTTIGQEATWYNYNLMDTFKEDKRGFFGKNDHSKSINFPNLSLYCVPYAIALIVVGYVINDKWLIGYGYTIVSLL